MKRASLSIAMVLSALLISGFAFAHMGGYHSQRGYGHMGMMGHGMMGGYGMMGYGMMHNDEDCPLFMHHNLGAQYYLRLEAELELSEKQIEALKAIKEDVDKEFIRKKADLDELLIELDDALGEEKVNLSKAKALNKNIAALQGELRFLRIEESIKARAVLSEGQLEKLVLEEEDLHRMGRGAGCCPRQ